MGKCSRILICAWPESETIAGDSAGSAEVLGHSNAPALSVDVCVWVGGGCKSFGQRGFSGATLLVVGSVWVEGIYDGTNELVIGGIDAADIVLLCVCAIM